MIADGSQLATTGSPLEETTKAEAERPGPDLLGQSLLHGGCPPNANAPRRTRTYNPLIKSQLLCQLS